MFNVSLFGFDPAVYEAIIAAFIVVGLIQSLALRRKAKQLVQSKHTFTALSIAAAKTIAALLVGLTKQHHELDDARRIAMEAQADADDARAEIERSAADIDLTLADIADRKAVGVSLFRIERDGSLTSVPSSTLDFGSNPRSLSAADIDSILADIEADRKAEADPYARLADSIKASAMNPEHPQPDYHSPRAG